jgi:hypothetical protein
MQDLRQDSDQGIMEIEADIQAVGKWLLSSLGSVKIFAILLCKTFPLFGKRIHISHCARSQEPPIWKDHHR